MEFRILGSIEVRIGGERVGLGGPKVKALLAALALQPNQVVSADRLVEALWGEHPPRDAANSLQGYVSQLRKALGAEHLATRPPGYVLAVDPESIDAVRFERLVGQGREALGAGDAAMAATWLSEAMGLWRGEALGEFTAHAFARADAARLGELRLGAVEDLAEARLALGEHARVAAELPALVEANPLRERLWGQLGLALYRCGRQGEARETLATLRQRLGEELGIDPSTALRALEEAVAAQDPALDWAPMASPPAAEVPSNLPAARSSFVGREEELAELEELLSRPRLLTVVGPGGVGKTRLGIEVARRLCSRYPDGVWLVELAPLGDAALVPAAVAAALGVREEAGRPLTATLGSHLADRRSLVVLDNCEHLIDAAAALADVLLRAAPGLGMLATSREPLLIDGETLWRARPLAVAEGDHLAPEALLGYDAVRLFCERAQSAEPAFALDATNAAAVARLCRRLDGIPLAIELAAARSRGLSPAQIADRLDDRFRLLTTGSRTAQARQQTLQAAVDWSHDLLSEPERTLFRRLSVFRGFALEAAEVVCAGEDLDARDVPGVLSDLVDRSLVVAQPLDDGTLRYSLLETLRDYAAGRLAESGEQEAVSRRHFEWELDLAERFRAEMGPRPADGSPYQESRWIRKIQLEHDNLRQALGWAVSREPVGALRLANELGPFWRIVGHLREGREWLQLSRAATPVTPLLLQARALANEGQLALAQGDLTAAWPLLEQAVTLARALSAEDEGGRVLRLRVLPLVASAARQRSDLVTARACLEEARALHYVSGGADDGPILQEMGRVSMQEGDQSRALECFEEALVCFRRVGVETEASECETFLGKLALLQHDYGTAERLLEGALEVHQRLGNQRMTAMSLGALAELHVQLGDLRRARSLFEQELSIARDVGLQTFEAEALDGLEHLSSQPVPRQNETTLNSSPD